MTILTADVRDIGCLFFSQMVEFIDNTNYGIECDEEDLLINIKKTLKHYEFGCWYDDYIRETIEEEADNISDVCDRHTFVQA